MSEAPRAAEAQMQMRQIRNDIDQGVEEMVGNARSMFDWRHYVRTYPWVCLGTAVALGYLIVPKRPATIHQRPIQQRPTTSAALPRAGETVMKPVPAVLHGVVDALLATAVNVAVRQATAYVGLGVGKLLGNESDHPTRAPLDGTAERSCPLR
jgi:hypothetical protein